MPLITEGQRRPPYANARMTNSFPLARPSIRANAINAADNVGSILFFDENANVHGTLCPMPVYMLVFQLFWMTVRMTMLCFNQVFALLSLQNICDSMPSAMAAE